MLSLAPPFLSGDKKAPSPSYSLFPAPLKLAKLPFYSSELKTSESLNPPFLAEASFRRPGAPVAPFLNLLLQIIPLTSWKINLIQFWLSQQGAAEIGFSPLFGQEHPLLPHCR